MRACQRCGSDVGVARKCPKCGYDTVKNREYEDGVKIEYNEQNKPVVRKYTNKENRQINKSIFISYALMIVYIILLLIQRPGLGFLFYCFIIFHSNTLTTTYGQNYNIRVKFNRQIIISTILFFSYFVIMSFI